MNRIVLSKTFIGTDISKIEEDANNFKRKHGSCGTTPGQFVVHFQGHVEIYHKLTIHYEVKE